MLAPQLIENLLKYISCVLMDKSLSCKQKKILIKYTLKARKARRKGLKNPVELRDGMDIILNSNAVYHCHKDVNFKDLNLDTMVVVPTLCKSLDDIDKLRNLLKSLQNQKTHLKYRILVVNDGSQLDIESFIDDLHKITFVNLTKNFGPAYARNIGIEVARRSKVTNVAFTDTDCVTSKKWLENLYYSMKEFAIVGGRTLAKYADTKVGFYHDYHGTLNGRRIKNKMLYVPSCNIMINIYKIHESFDPKFCKASFEDIQFCLKNQNIGFSRDAVIYHDYSSLKKQFYKYAQCEHLIYKEFPEYKELLKNSTTISNIKN